MGDFKLGPLNQKDFTVSSSLLGGKANIGTPKMRFCKTNPNAQMYSLAYPHLGSLGGKCR